MRWQYLSLIFASVASASNAARFDEMGNTHKDFTNELNSRQLVTSDSCDCSGTKPNATTGLGYICHDYRLGPTCLPRIWPLLSLVSDYDRFGGLTPGAFLKQWTYPEGSVDSHNRSNAGRWHYPDHDGFQLDNNNNSMAGNMTLLPGLLVDRFGYESGTFLSTADTPYSQRSLPPASLDNPDLRSTEFPSNYHVYKVLKPLTVLGGPIAPAFGQPGLGTQFDTNQAGDVRGNISTLVAQKFLQPVNLSTIIIGPGKGGSCGL